MINIHFAADDARWDEFKSVLPAALDAAGIKADLSRNHAPSNVDYIVFAPNGPLADFTPFTRTKAVLGLWAGVETIVGNTTLTQPLTRMVDAGLKRGMVEWVTGHVLRHHLGMDAHIINPDQRWIATPPPLAKNRRVAILGLGELGEACAAMLAQFGFELHGFSRSAKQIEGVICHSGEAGLEHALEGAEMVILLLPDTPQTDKIINAERLGMLAKGAAILNPGRGTLIDDSALMSALTTGQIGHATLDTFRQEPLPQEHPFWAHPNITVTPHIASETRADTSSEVIVENIRRCEAGAPLLYLVDRTRGY